VKARLRKQLEVAGVIVMHMRNHDIEHRTHIDTYAGQPLRDRTCQRAASGSGRGRRKAGVDHDRTLLALNEPDEVIEWHARGVVIPAEKILIAGSLQMTVMNGKYLIHAGAPSDRGQEPAINVQNLAVDVRGLIAQQEE